MPGGIGFYGCPVGIAVDNTCSIQHLTGSACTALDPSSGDLYVPDYEFGVVRQFSPDSGSRCRLTIGADQRPANHPTGVAVDPTNGNVYVANDILRWPGIGFRL